MESLEDPFDWTVDDVVTRLCNANTSWSSSTAPSVLPDPTFFELALRENHIDGVTLLTEVDRATLQYHLGLKSVGHIGTVMRAVQRLRSQSPKYLQHIQEMASNTPLPYQMSQAPGSMLSYPGYSPFQHRQTPSLVNGYFQSPSTSPWHQEDNLRNRFHRDNESNMSPAPVDALSQPHKKRRRSDGSPEKADTSPLPRIATPTPRETSVEAGSPGNHIPNEPETLISAASSTQAQVPIATRISAIASPAHPEEDYSRDPQHPDITTTTLTNLQSADPCSDCRSGETFIVDSSGRKRRKLTLMASDALQMNQVHSLVVPESTSATFQSQQQPAEDMREVVTRSGTDADREVALAESSSPLPMASSQPNVVNDPKRARNFEEQARPSSARHSRKQITYFGPKALPVDFIFYGDTLVGEELQNDHEPIRNKLAEEENWTFTTDPTLPAGQRLYVNNRLQSSLRRSTRTQVRRGGKEYIALEPYPSRVLSKHLSPSFSLFTMDGARATREDVLRWPELSRPADHKKQTLPLDTDIKFPGSNIPESKAFELDNKGSYTDQWDFLKKWQYMEGDKVEPVYGESGSENEYDLDTWQQIEAENGTLDRPKSGQHTRRPLDPETVSEAINSCIEGLLAKWKEKEQPKLERKARTIWKRSRHCETKQSDIREAQEHIERITNGPLAKMRKEILAEVWTSLPKVHRACAILEQTVFNREELSWRISILRSKIEPPRPDAKAAKPKPAKLDTKTEVEEGEPLESFSESEDSADDGLDDFIVDDELSDEHHSLNAERGLTDADDEDISMGITEVGSTDEEITTPSKRHAVRRRTIIEDDEDVKSNRTVDTSDTVRATSPSPTLSAPRLSIQPAWTSPRGLEKAKPIDLTLSSDISASEVVPKPRVTAPSRSEDRSLDTVKPKVEQDTASNSPRRTAFVDLGSASSEDFSDEDLLVDDMDSDLPSYDDISAISKLDWHILEANLDRKRLLIKLIHRMTLDQRTFLISRVSSSKFEGMQSDVWGALKAINAGRTRIAGNDDVASQHLMSFASLFLMWKQCQRAPPKHGFLKTTIHQVLNDRNIIKDSFKPFFSLLCQALTRYDEAGSETGLILGGTSSELAYQIPSGEDSHAIDDFSRRPTRKYFVPENLAARDLRASDQQRVRDQQRRRQQLQRLMPRMGIDSEQNPAQILINTSKFEHEDFVFLNPHIGQRIKAHQIEGVQFMWRELVTDERSLQGCLLAHSMGLGKTMQVITLLVTIAEAAKSENPRISKQIPKSLKESRTLVLSPPSLLDNWWDEFLIWAPEPAEANVGQLRKVDSSIKTPQRLEEITAWYDGGGVLLISYDMFRLCVENKSTKSRKPPLTDQQHEDVKRHLLEGPNIIVADEAHKMKNPTAAITVAAFQFKSRSRIALTGSPLANNLEEYYAMINWIAEGYLGDSIEFRAKYVEPIQEGLYFDSLVEEQRRSLKMLHVLKVDLDPKVSRADITVLKGSLKPKVEFVIKVPLTKIQADAYALYVRTLLNGDTEIGWARLWNWLAILSLLNNHPVCFKNKLLAREEGAEKASKLEPKSQKGIKQAMNLAPPNNVVPASDDENTVSVPGDAPVTKMGISKALIDQELKLLESVSGALESMVHSYKVQIFNQILNAASEIGEKVLVFSHSIPTLNFLESLLKTASRRYSRLDGKTKMTDRQKATKDFNTGNTEVYLVSTKAGGLGLNLPGANRVIIFDFKFNPILEEQAVGRAYRIGQTKPVYVYRFLAGGTFEEVVHNKAVFKMQLASRVVDKKNPMRSASRKAREYLFEPMPVKKDDLSEFMGKDPLVLDIILAQQDRINSIRSIQLTETFQREENEKLTAEEEAETKQMIKDEQMKRTDLAAYEKMVLSRQKTAAAEYLKRVRVENRPSTQPLPMAPPGNFGSAVDLHIPTSQLSQPPNKESAIAAALPASAAHSANSGEPGLEPIAGANTKVKETTPPTSTEDGAATASTAAVVNPIPIPAGVVIQRPEAK
ncbi:MAG: hypothetical protein M1835_005510 [Candelina submexicana]|nr:MAG: hypothetical protein M1835_005510 [Candelina submexicana]